MQIEFAIPGKTFTVTLDDSAAARSLVDQLPLTLAMRDFHGIEKVADLPARLSTKGAPDGMKPSVGALTYYAPWGNLAFFYKPFGFADGLVALGTVDGDPAVLQRISDGDQASVTLVS